MKTGLQKAAELLLPDVPSRLKVKEVIERLLAEENIPVICAPRAVPHDTTSVLFEVQKERRRQEERWGQQNHDMADYYTILGEEFGEVGKAICESKLQGKVPAAQIRAELIQTAAVAVAMVEAFDRQQVKP